MHICNICNKSFNSKYNYERHIKRKNSCYEKLECPKCFKIFNHRGNYKKHINRENNCELDKYKLTQENKENELIIYKNDIKLLQAELIICKNKIKNLESENDSLKIIIQKYNLDKKI